jgi:hypothetical protein
MVDNANRISLFRRAAAEQGGLLSGKDPTEFNTADPLRLWIIQIGLSNPVCVLLACIYTFFFITFLAVRYYNMYDPNSGTGLEANSPAQGYC